MCSLSLFPAPVTAGLTLREHNNELVPGQPHTQVRVTHTHTVTVHFTHLIQSVSAYVMTLNVPQYSLMGISGFD